MESLYGITLITHIVSGYTALTTGAVVMFARKGNRLHRILGRIFYFAMIGVAFTSIGLSIYKELIFLFHIALFVLYQTYAGFRSVRDKTLVPSISDYFILLMAFVNGIFMLMTLIPVLVIFGSINMFLIYIDLKVYYSIIKRKEIKKLTWLSRHIGMMIGSYIAAVTAFIVVNINGAGAYYWLVWLGPTIVLFPLMRFFVNKYTKRNSKYFKIAE